jgi:hypothetical protein
MRLTATIVITDTDSGEMFRYDGGDWIQYCDSGISAQWEDIIYVAGEDGRPVIDFTLNDIATAVLQWVYEGDDDTPQA